MATFFKLLMLLISIVKITTSKDVCKLCVCTEEKVECIGLNLTYVPILPKDTVTFSFVGNIIPIVNNDTFRNISSLKITRLKLSSNKIKYVDKHTFRTFHNLKRLDFSNNNLTLESIYNIFYACNVGRIGGLLLKNIGLLKIPPDLCQGPRHSLLKLLDLSNNHINVLNFTIFKNLKTLNTLKVGNNNLHSLVPDEAPNLQQLHLYSNFLRDIPTFCMGNKSFFPRLNLLRLQNNSICEYLPQNIKCLKKLADLRLSDNCMAVFKSNSFSDLPSLKYLRLTHQHSVRSSITFEKYAFNNSNIKYLSLIRDGILIKHFDTLALAGCDNIQELDLSYNTFYGYEPENTGKINRVLSPLTKITTLGLSYTYLKTVPEVIKKLPNLKHLNLRGNDIISWSEGVFDFNPRLTYLTLQFNRIKTITQDMFPSKIRNQLTSLGLGKNPYICNCDLVWFIQWLNRDHKKFQNYPESYTCINITERICLNNIPVFRSITSIICILVGVILISSFLYKYRWSIKYQIYIWRHRPNQLRNLAERQFQYDVFVSYSVEDSNWVLNHLVGKLEDEEDLKLCIHERDFTPGRLIIDNIVESIEDSRFVLIVLSNNFARSDWCQFEMTLAQQNVLRHMLEPLVVVLLEDINNEYMSKALKALLTTTTYLTWSNAPDVVDTFWDRLKRTFRNREI